MDGHRAAPRGGRGDELARPGRAGPRGGSVRPARRADRDRPGRHRLRPRARRVPPLPAARPRPWRLGDDDRPPLPVRQRRRRSASRRSPRGRGRRCAELVGKLVREERYHRMHAGAWLDRLARSDGEPRDRLLAALAELAPDAATVFTPLEDEAELLDAGILDAPIGRARGSLARLDRPGLRDPRPSDAAAGARSGAWQAGSRHAISLGCGASSRPSAAPIRERPGERGRDPGRGGTDAGRRDHRGVARPGGHRRSTKRPCARHSPR